MTRLRRLALATAASAAAATAALILLDRTSARLIAATDQRYPTLLPKDHQ